MGKSYVGLIILAINGIDIECKSLKPQHDLGRKPIKTMNRQGRSQGWSKGIPEYKLTISAPVQPSGYEVDWDNIENAEITIYSQAGEPLEVYRSCATVSKGTQYDVDGESYHDVEMGALDHKLLKVTIL